MKVRVRIEDGRTRTAVAVWLFAVGEDSTLSLIQLRRRLQTLECSLSKARCGLLFILLFLIGCCDFLRPSPTFSGLKIILRFKWHSAPRISHETECGCFEVPLKR
ncbi:hypothetical protein F0562_025144 [Nyssa sinensis]|uniref:Uncharacterized protein n=1 Tax=Nyssa sinensis TaxID=561372 RepID=A0A5J5BEX6_9ASTE|nr:hypothetical protein F0562_025144 [Nyssa sinensis]